MPNGTSNRTGRNFLNWGLNYDLVCDMMEIKGKRNNMVRVPSDLCWRMVGQGMAGSTATRYRLSSAVHARAIVSYLWLDFNSFFAFFYFCAKKLYSSSWRPIGSRLSMLFGG